MSSLTEKILHPFSTGTQQGTQGFQQGATGGNFPLNVIFDVCEFTNQNILANIQPTFSCSINNEKTARYTLKNVTPAASGMGTGQGLTGSTVVGGPLQLRETVPLSANNVYTDVLFVELFDKNYGPDRLIGLGTVPLNRLATTGVIDEWLTLYPSSASSGYGTGTSSSVQQGGGMMGGLMGTGGATGQVQQQPSQFAGQQQQQGSSVAQQGGLMNPVCRLHLIVQMQSATGYGGAQGLGTAQGIQQQQQQQPFVGQSGPMGGTKPPFAQTQQSTAGMATGLGGQTSGIPSTDPFRRL